MKRWICYTRDRWGRAIEISDPLQLNGKLKHFSAFTFSPGDAQCGAYWLDRTWVRYPEDGKELSLSSREIKGQAHATKEFEILLKAQCERMADQKFDQLTQEFLSRDEVRGPDVADKLIRSIKPAYVAAYTNRIEAGMAGSHPVLSDWYREYQVKELLARLKPKLSEAELESMTGGLPLFEPWVTPEGREE